jgi:hypothetical protein
MTPIQNPNKDQGKSDHTMRAGCMNKYVADFRINGMQYIHSSGPLSTPHNLGRGLILGEFVRWIWVNVAKPECKRAGLAFDSQCDGASVD